MGKTMPVVGVFLAGGRGERFWPLSRRGSPKPLLRLGSSGTLLEGTLSRLHGWLPEDRLFVVTTQALRRSIRPVLARFPKVRIIPESSSRNTASAIALAAQWVQKRFGDAVMVVLPIDHAIDPVAPFLADLDRAVGIAKGDENALILFGIKPRSAATGLGYVVAGARNGGALRVDRFIEKPSKAQAQRLCRRRNVYWNSGIFVFRARAILAAIHKVFPSGVLPSESIDHAVLQKVQGLKVIPSTFSWYDLGTWPAMDALLPADARENRRLGMHACLDTQGSILVSDQNHLIATLGVRDLVIVHTPDATLVASRDKAEQVRDLVRRIGEDRRLRKFL